MSVIGYQQTLSALDSVMDRFRIAHTANITLPATASATVINATATMPETSTSGNGAGIVFSGRFNYAKIQPLVNVASQAFVMHVVGFSRADDSTYRPMLLCTVNVTASGSGTGQTINAATLFPGLTYSKVNGDCKIFNGNAAICNGGGILVDILGYERVEIVMTVASGTVTGNALISLI
jgi:hypothetical protein